MNIEVTGLAVPRFSRRAMATFARRVLRAVGGQEELDEISIALVNDRSMRTLNRKFRDRKTTTDVLTFPGEHGCEIVISLDRAHRQAAGEKHALATELRYLILHGILHGLGHDHESDDGEMDALELRTREAVGLD